VAQAICEACRALLASGDGIDTRECAICGATVCREESRKARVRFNGGDEQQVVACRDWGACAIRHGARVIK
jgi:hypothetical protein